MGFQPSTVVLVLSKQNPGPELQPKNNKGFYFADGYLNDINFNNRQSSTFGSSEITPLAAAR